MLFDDSNKLSNEQIRQRLTEAGYSLSLIDSIIEEFWFHDWGNSFISDPSYFQILLRYLKDSKPKKFSRFDFYAYFYTSIPNFKELRVPLQKLGMVFELMQTDRLPLHEFSELIREVIPGNALNIKFLHDVNLLTTITEDGKTQVRWNHHSLTEFLAADYIRDQKDILKAAEKFIIYSESGITTFIPSWAGVLRFLLEQNSQDFINWIIGLIEKNPDFLNDHLAETLVFSTPDTINQENKTSIFNTIYNSYQSKKWWIPVWAYHHLYKFIDQKIYRDLRDSADNPDYIYKGNVAAVIDGMLQHNHPILNKEEKDFWKERLIGYANEEKDNGVLQRHAMAALENFKGDADIIQKVKSKISSPDSLVREAFINMCRNVAPDSEDSINYFVAGIAEDSAHIYARNALYNITSVKGIETFLEKISTNPRFIHEFLDKENIFNGRDKNADQELIKSIEKVANPNIIGLLKKIILMAFIGDRNYDAGKSYFLQQLTKIISSRDPDYLNELIKEIRNLPAEQKNTLFVNDIESIIAVLLKPDQLEELQEVFTDKLHNHAGFTFAEAIRIAPQVGNPKGEAVLKKGIELSITSDPKTFPQYTDYQKQQEVKTYKQFQSFLSPGAEGQYYPQVFRYFIESQAIVEKYWTEDEKARLLNLAVESNLKKIELEKIKVRYKHQETKSGEYTISSIAGFFGDVLQVIFRLKPSILQTPENRKKVINFLPYAYSNDLNVIEKILGEVTDEEIEEVNKKMLSQDEGDDARYLVTQSYIYFVSQQSNLTSPKKILESFITDPLVSDSDRVYALKNLKPYLSPTNSDDKKFLEPLWGPDKRDALSDTANALLISVFQDEGAIDWRFEILKSSAEPFRTPEGVHSVGALEEELTTISFAYSLIELADEKYLPKFIDLLNFSITLVEKKEYWEYVNYLWRIVIGFVIRETSVLSESAVQQLKIWAKYHETVENINWFQKQLGHKNSNFLTNSSHGITTLEALKRLEKIR